MEANAMRSQEVMQNIVARVPALDHGAIDHAVLPRDATLRHLLKPLLEYIHMNGATDVCINKPGVVFVEKGAEWKRFENKLLTLDKLNSFSECISNYTEQDISERQPILSAMLPDGERIQIVRSPAVEHGNISLTIRVPSKDIRPLDEYEADGAFNRYLWAESPEFKDKGHLLSPVDRKLMEHLRERRLKEFLIAAIIAKKNICVVGDTGSGKTTLMKSLCQFIPRDERLITIEDVRELFLPQHENIVHLIYSATGQGVANITSQELIKSCMRMKPDRVLLAELRSAEAFDFLNLLTTGHSGSITSFHAESCALAPERYVFMAKEHEKAATSDPEELKRKIALTIDVVVHVIAEKVYDDQGNPLRKERYVTEVSFDPIEKFKTRFGNAVVHGAGA